MIRVMEETDLPAVASLEWELYSDPWQETDYLPYLKDGRSVLLTAVAGGKTAGYIAVSAAADEGDILRVGVAKASQRRGIGKELVEAAIARARAGGIRRLFLEVRSGNTPARRLYESCGFETIGLRKRYYRDPEEDAIMMRRILPPL